MYITQMHSSAWLHEPRRETLLSKPKDTDAMAIMKVIEVMGYSSEGWEDAAQRMVTDASKTVKNIKSIYINEMSAKVENNQIVEYRLNGKITFEVRDTK